MKDRQQIIYRRVGKSNMYVEYVDGRLKWWHRILVWLAGYKVGYEDEIL